MRIFSALLAILLVVCLFQPDSVLADSIDKHINNLKSDDPEVRAKAAFDLGCS